MFTLIKKYKKVIAFLTFLYMIINPTISFAHDAYFLQVLIDDFKFQYIGSVVEDNASTFSAESKHIENELGEFGNLANNPFPTSPTTKEGFESQARESDTMIFTFAPIEANRTGYPKNHATKEDVEKAYFVQETLMVGLNDALRIVNGGTPFKNIDELINRGNELANAINSNGTVNGYKITKGKTSSGGNIKGVTNNDYITISKGTEKYEFVYKVKKGYKNVEGPYKSSYSNDTEYITWNQLMYQANYAYFVKTYTIRNGSEALKPNALEEWIVGLFENTFNQLRNLLGLYEINELVFNEGIRGSQAYTHGIMNKSWSDNAIAYHWLFQALAWSLITFAIVKNLVQRNLATINPVMRISLIESIQNLLITGFILANAIPVLNMFMFLNAKLVGVFGATAPNFSDIAGMNYYSNFLGGILIQFFYLGVAIYLNFVYIMRAITVAILIATAPMFIVTIAFGGHWKQLFNTWMREIIGNIFLQSFHAFMLSFFFAISTSARGIEGMVVTMALIPMTEFFRKLVIGQGGGIAHTMGLGAMAQGASLVGGTMASNSKKGSTTKSSNGSSRESNTTNNNDSGMKDISGKSDKIKANSENMSQRQRMNTTKETLNQKGTPVNVSDNFNHPDRDKYQFDNLQTQPEGKLQTTMDKVQGVREKIAEGKETLNNNPFVKTTGGALKTAVGAGKVAVGLGTAMALGSVSPAIGSMGLNGAKNGFDSMKSGASETLVGAGSFIPQKSSDYATTLSNGDIQIHRDGNALRKEGIERATMDSNNNAIYTYNTNLSNADKANIIPAYQAFRANDTEAITHYKKQGIESISRSGDGKLMVSYNKVGMEKMGIKSVQTVGAGGSNPRIIETKSGNAPIQTMRSISMEHHSRYSPMNNSSNSATGTSVVPANSNMSSPAVQPRKIIN